jgi:hypothetical protein
MHINRRKLTLEGGAFPTLTLAQKEYLDLFAAFELCLAGFLLLAELLIDTIADLFSFAFASQPSFACCRGLVRRGLKSSSKGIGHTTVANGG